MAPRKAVFSINRLNRLTVLPFKIRWDVLVVRSILYPQLPLRALPRLLLLALVGSLIAGGYGVIHDQITFTLAPEYFTKFKFEQFAYADPGGGERAFVLMIGFLATWWVGMIAGWVLGRVAILPSGKLLPIPRLLCLFAIILAFAAASGAAGFVYGTLTWDSSETAWSSWRARCGVRDLPAFARAGHIHNFGYLGALIGLIVAAVIARRQTLRLSGSLHSETTRIW